MCGAFRTRWGNENPLQERTRWEGMDWVDVAEDSCQWLANES